MVEKVRRLDGEKEIILVNNTPKSRILNQYLDDLVAVNPSWCKRIVSPENLGTARGFNAGLELASSKSDIYVFMSTDADIIDFQMLTKIKQAFADDVKLGIAHPYSVFEDSDIYNVSRRLSYRAFKQAIKLGQRASNIEPTESELTNLLLTLKSSDRIVFSPIKTFPLTFAAIAKKVIATVGSFDNRFLLGCYENNDLAYRSLKAGLKVGRLGNTLVNHKRFTVRELTVANDAELKQLPHVTAVSQAADLWIEKYGRNYDEMYFEFRFGRLVLNISYPYFLFKRFVRKLRIKTPSP
jgi:GT2 family glycosyltransferase